ncbi:HAD family hydrolase [Embleya sp. NBC_00896]|uniref:HAD family hydrolase n=1 Tax=Embleya sp. NBC_00896 TaxID=2975961 RepID=UPI002F91ABC3|nr:HAD family hydrolase [Embleya sp. NBC_00896]
MPHRVEDAEEGVSLLGLIGISDPPRESARTTIAACHEARITPVMITGDHPSTARAVATRLGMLRDGDTTALTGADLRADPERDPTAVRVFARTTPEQKPAIIQAWRARGHVTAMAGDGVNESILGDGLWQRVVRPGRA